MNYFAHGRSFLDDPYFLAGTQLPDWLCVVDRKVRVRSKTAAPFLQHGQEQTRRLAQGVLQHHHDDRWFHQTRAFNELNWELARRSSTLLASDEGFRPSFLAHLLVELLLDAALIEEQPELLEAYYRTLSELDASRVADIVGRMCGQQVQRLPHCIQRFCQEQFLYDYLQDAKLLMRLNNVMQRVRLPRLPERAIELLPEARSLVALRKEELLGGDAPSTQRRHHSGQ